MSINNQFIVQVQGPSFGGLNGKYFIETKDPVSWHDMERMKKLYERFAINSCRPFMLTCDDINKLCNIIRLDGEEMETYESSTSDNVIVHDMVKVYCRDNERSIVDLLDLEI